MDMTAKQWYKSTVSLEKGIEKTQNDKRSRDDITCEFRHMMPAIQDNVLGYEYVDGRFFQPTQHAWKQICAWHDMPTHLIRWFHEDQIVPKDANRSITRGNVDWEIARALLQRQRKLIDPSKRFLFRTYDDGTMRMMASDKYAIIDNEWYLNIIKDLFGEIGGTEPRLFKWRANEDTIYGNLLLLDTVIEKDDGEYGGMISLGNCEIGKRSLSQVASIFRGICTNGCIFGKEVVDSLKKKHLGNIDLDDLTVKITENIKAQIPAATAGIERFLKLKDRKLEAGTPLKNVFAVLAKRGGFSVGIKGQANAVVEEFVTHEMANENLFGMVNAITRAGQRYAADEWLRMDQFAGTLMNMTEGQWATVQKQAREDMTDKKMERIFGKVAA